MIRRLLTVIILLFIQFSTRAETIIVSTLSPVTSVRQAIEISKPGDKIIIKKGHYAEGNIIVTKRVEIRGEDYPELDGQLQNEILTIRADSVIISGLILKNTGFSYMKDYAAVRIEESKNCIIDNNKLLDNFFGIYLAASSNCIVRNNEIISHSVNEYSSGNGIHLWKCNNIIIQNNYITGHRDGIYFEFATNSLVKNNKSENNLRYGLHFMFSNSDDYEYNTFSNNGAGVAVMYTKYVRMVGNRFENNWGSNAYGLLLKEIGSSYIHKNIFYKNTIALYSEGGTNLMISGNDYIENGWALRILGNCIDDTIKQNNFIGNTFDVTTNSSQNANLFVENYWDKYRGYDIDRDGIGDVSYRPVSVFSMIVEYNPGTIVLLRSFIVDLLDLTEKIVPVIIPETLIDDKPLMQQYLEKGE